MNEGPDGGEIMGRGSRGSLLLLGTALLIVSGVLLLQPPKVEVPAPAGSATAETPTVSVDANYETAAIAAGIAGCLFLLLGVLKLKPAGLNFAGTQLSFRHKKAKEIERRPGDREALVKQAASELGEKAPSAGREEVSARGDAEVLLRYLDSLKVSDGSTPPAPGLTDAKEPTAGISPGSTAKAVRDQDKEAGIGEHAQAVLSEMSLEGLLTLNSKRHWDHFFPWVRHAVEEWALENSSDISVDPSTRIVGAQRTGEGSGNFAWKVDVLSDSGEIISLRVTERRGGERFKRAA